MKSFKAYLAEDDHKHPNFEKQYACFSSYLGRQAQNGDTSAQEYVLDSKQMRVEYDEHLLQTTVDISRTSASEIVNTSVERYTSGPSIHPLSAARAPPIDREWGSSSPTLSPPHRPLFDVNGDVNEQDQCKAVEGGAAIRVFDDHEAFGGNIQEEDELFGPAAAGAETEDVSWIQQRLITDSHRRTSDVASSTEEFEEISALEKSPTNTMLGKRGRTHRDEADDYTRAKAVANLSPFLSKDDESEPLDDYDPVRQAQTVPNASMNIVFDMEDYEFTAKLDEIDFGKEFTANYDHCRPLSYGSDNLSDFVALSGVHFLEDRPTSFQKTYFGPKCKQLLDLIDSRISYPTAGEVADALQLCRNVKDICVQTLVQSDNEAP